MLMSMERKTLACLESWSDELLSRANRVRQLIGDAHWLSDGHHKEALFRTFLLRHLPSNFNITRGFICPAESTLSVSPEIDILVTDSSKELPWFSEADLTIAPPASVCAHIHVKTEFNTPEIVSILESCALSARSAEESTGSRESWSGALFFAQTNIKSDQDLRDKLANALASFSNGTSRLAKPSIKHIPHCLTIVGGPMILLEATTANHGKVPMVKAKAYNCGNLSSAIFLSHLYDSLPLMGREQKRRGDWELLIEQAEYTIAFDELFPFQNDHEHIN